MQKSELHKTFAHQCGYLTLLFIGDQNDKKQNKQGGRGRVFSKGS